MNFYRCLRPLLFRCDPEWIHNRTIGCCQWAGRLALVRRTLAAAYEVRDPRLVCHVAGLRFSSPIGLAAGFDKNGRAVECLAHLGFGSIEVGSVSRDRSEGNPQPRLFRLPQDEAIVVNYGVPNDGADAVADRLRSYSHRVPLGLNIVETNTGQAATASEVIEQFVQVARKFIGIADYLALNLACPNTTAGESVFNDPAVLRELLTEYETISNLPPVFAKLAATTEEQQIGETVEVCAMGNCLAGFIFNLPPHRDYSFHTPADRLAQLPGSVSGRPVHDLMNRTIRSWYRRIDRDRHVIIGGGGIFAAEDAYRQIRLGASAVQLYTALVYHGPARIKQINRGLTRLLDRDGFHNLNKVVWIDA